MILLKNCFYLVKSADDPGSFGVDVLIRGNRVEAVGSNLAMPADAEGRVIDASRHVVIPGLVNTHHHFYQTLTRNLPAVQNAKLFTWLVYLYEIWKYLDEDAIYWSTALATAELLKTGCTLTTDHHYLYPGGVGADIMALQFKAAGDTGIRFSPTRGSMSLSKKDGGLPPDTVVQSEDDILVDSERVIREFHDSDPFSMRKIALAPCSPFSVSEQSMKDTAALARKYGVLLHTHLAETKDENKFCERTLGRRPLKVMEDCDFVGPDVWFAHGIHFTDDELSVLQETGCQIAHCPTSNMRLGSGICRVKEMKEMGINVALAVDGSASNDSSDMLGEIRNALFLQRVAHGADALTGRDVFRMATENGARLLNFEKAGIIEEGGPADIALFDVHKLEYAGSLSDPLGALIFSGYNHGTDYTIVNGKLVVEKGRLTGIDEEDLSRRANAAASRLYEKAGIV
ncbi:8-oxoguanine deaminase [Marispirochaeta aestuarii]|uniref:8-oxoguanine deaminase n=1 Tax=Marispirochaeta aestuarii TaxID=1963862 RepID=A0A1Y1RVL3_9SPIO|nr:8-oxoguanine deaminase [Marispirochaeta aestuarii]ORC34014.1 8-oxoguanine deaminase [Marispirochaeta aestuarii]